MLKAFYSGRKIVYQLTTKTGRSIKASANHPFLKLEGWTPLENLESGMHIALPREYPNVKSDSQLTREELKLLAHLLGDGCILPKQPYHYTSQDKENISEVNSAAKNLFDIEGKLVPQENWFHLYLPSPYRLSRGKNHPITDWYKKLGLPRVRSYEKLIPQDVFGCSHEDTAYFLKHLWSTDGNISYKKIKGRKCSGAIYYASSSFKLSRQVQHLLLRQGIQSTLRAKTSSKGYRCMYHVSVQSTPYQKLFLNKVGAIGERGRVGSALLTELDEICANPNNDVIPKEIWQQDILDSKRLHNKSWRKVAEELGMSYCGSTLFKSGVSRERLSQINSVLPSATLHNLAESDIYWDEITSIEKLGEEDVYDATVEEVHNFVANDIIVHNSIEQDADIVMFLLRREYYDPMDKPGMAELIIGKNRHGGVGIINLTYRKEIAQFANFTPLKKEGNWGGGSNYPDNDEAFAAFTP
jgi:replicative DNA helicase